jgi:hypothetical protein
MATVQNVLLGIAPSATKPGYSDISYSYELCPDEQDGPEQRDYTVSVTLWGEDVFDDDVLDTDLDRHAVSLAGRGPGEAARIERTFQVATKLLDEDFFGDDEVFLVVEASTEHDRTSGRSNTVKGDF